MKKLLKKQERELFYFDKEGNKIAHKTSAMYGNCTDLRGDCTNLRGDCTNLRGYCSADLRGNCTGLRGNCAGLYGNCSGLTGDLDNCEITDEDRKNGINIEELIG